VTIYSLPLKIHTEIYSDQMIGCIVCFKIVQEGGMVKPHGSSLHNSMLNILYYKIKFSSSIFFVLGVLLALLQMTG
jgi:hypothetical protein